MNYEMFKRRNFLKSAGVAIALPLLESLPEAQAARKIGNRSNASYVFPITTAYIKKLFFPDVNQPGPNYEMLRNPPISRKTPKEHNCFSEFGPWIHRWSPRRSGILEWSTSDSCSQLSRRKYQSRSETCRVPRSFNSLSFHDSRSSRAQPAQFHPHRRAGSQHRHAGSLQGNVL